MMIAYRALRWCARVGLRWFYRRIEVKGLEHLPADGPVILAANHPNALVDALVVGCALPRPVRLTAKATLLDNPLTRGIVAAVGIIPLRRAKDETKREDGVPSPERNRASFDVAADALAQRQVLLIFPEGISHSEPSLAPLRTGCARIALHALHSRHIETVPVIPVGLTFERKWEPRTRAVVLLGAPIVLRRHAPEVIANDVDRITSTVDEALRAVTLNFPSNDDRDQILRVAALVVQLEAPPGPMSAPDPPLADVIRQAMQLDQIRRRLPVVRDDLARACSDFLTRLDAFAARTQRIGAVPNDVEIPLSLGMGAVFVVREGLILLLGGPVAWWGYVNHWLPLRLARLVAARTSRSPDEPAMHRLVSGFVLVVVWYAIVGTTLGAAVGPVATLVYLLTALPAADWDFRLRDRLARAYARARTYLHLRSDAVLRRTLCNDLAHLRAEAQRLREAFSRIGDPGTDTPIHGHVVRGA